MKQIRAKILSNKEISKGRFKISLEAPAISGESSPGQFVMVKCSDKVKPFLRRPFSFHKIDKEGFELLYQVTGEGTALLSKKKEGEQLDLIGPLGTGFQIEEKRDAILIAGGIGVAPLYALAKDLKRRGILLKILLGTKTKSHILCMEDFKELTQDIEIATEDGSMGNKGLATNLLKPEKKHIIYACGPNAMLRATAKIAKENGALCQVSLEERMGCGTGVCMGCAVETATGYKRACKDGPVFNAGEIIWQS